MRRGIARGGALLGLALGLLVPGVHADDPEKGRQTFDALFAEDLARVRKTGETTDDVALAGRLLETARQSTDQPAFLALVCEAACDLALAHPSGYEAAAEAMGLVLAHVPAKAAAARGRLLEVRARQFDAATGDAKKPAGEALLDLLLEDADAKQKAGDPAEAAALLRRARPVAAAAGSPRLAEIDERSQAITLRMQVERRIKDVEALLERDPKNGSAREGLVRLYLVELDDPAAAAKVLEGVGDKNLKKYVPAAARPLEEAPELACLELGEWYAGLAGLAPKHARAPMYARAKPYLERFLSLHEAKNLDRTRGTVALGKVNEALAQLAAAATAKAQPRKPTKPTETAGGIEAGVIKPGAWVDILSLVDPAKDAVKGTWRRQDKALAVEPVEHGRIMIPVAPQGSYELRVSFVRQSGNQSVDFILPVGSSAVAVVLSGAEGAVSGLWSIDGNEADHNEAKVSPGRLQNGHEYRAECRVIVQGNQAIITVTLDGEPYFRWSGLQSALSVLDTKRLPDPTVLGLGAFGSNTVFRRVALRMLSGEARLLRPTEGGTPRGPLRKTPVIGNARGGDPFEDLPGQAGLLVGFGYATGAWAGHTVIKAIQPVFRTPAGDVKGAWHGEPGGTEKVILARPGYAVGALDGRSGDRLDSLRITFMRPKAGGLDTRDTYQSDWFGGKPGNEHTGGSGGAVVGIHGRCGADIDAIGLVETVAPNR